MKKILYVYQHDFLVFDDADTNTVVIVIGKYQFSGFGVNIFGYFV